MAPDTGCTGGPGAFVVSRTPDELTFIATCSKCGAKATSLSDGGVAILKLSGQHTASGKEKFDGLKKGLAPGQPAPPKPPNARKRAPRPDPPFDPVEGVSHSSAPYQFRPIRLKDLWQLHKLDAYDSQDVKKVKPKRFGVPSFKMRLPASAIFNKSL